MLNFILKSLQPSTYQSYPAENLWICIIIPSLNPTHQYRSILQMYACGTWLNDSTSAAHMLLKSQCNDRFEGYMYLLLPIPLYTE